MDVLVIGAGSVGRALARGCSAAGHTVALASAGLRPVCLPAGNEQFVDGLLRLWLTLARPLGRHLAIRVLTDSKGL